MKLFNIYQSYVKRTGLLKCHFYPSKWFENKIRIQKISSFGASWNIRSLPYNNILCSSERCGLPYISGSSVSAHYILGSSERCGLSFLHLWESWVPTGHSLTPQVGSSQRELGSGPPLLTLPTFLSVRLGCEERTEGFQNHTFSAN